ncbi:MAG: ABC transporter permease [Alphaproteobacteria bacterium]
MSVIMNIALTHLMSRKRQTVVSLLGIVLGVGFFLAVASMMRGSEQDFVRRLIDNSPHITLKDEYRNPSPQPVFDVYASGAVQLRHQKPKTELRGIRNYKERVERLESIPGLRVAAVLSGQVVVSYAGRERGVSITGFVPTAMRGVSTIESLMNYGTLDTLETDADGIIIGQALAEKLSLEPGNRLTVTAPNGAVKLMKVVGIFKSGNKGYDEGQVFALLKKVQALLDRPNVANRMIFQLDDPHRATVLARQVEAQTGYLAESWQEASADIMNTLAIRNTIMYSVVSAILIVAAFGIYNIISTIVMEKTRDIAIMKSMGFRARDVQNIFLIQGVFLGVAGSIAGCVLGMGMMWGLGQIVFKTPFNSDPAPLPIDWNWVQFVIAAAFALTASMLAAWLPARKAGRVHPVAILRGAS